MPLGLLGKKLGQTRVYDAHGAAIHVTVVQCGPNRVLQCRTLEKDGYTAVQLGFGAQKPQRLTKAELGHLVKHGVLNEDDAKKARAEGDKQALQGVAHLREFRDFSKDVKTGDLLGPSLFNVGDYVDVIGVTKGRGFEGVVKRHHFAGGDSTHGAKGWHRRSGAIGCRLFPGTVRRGLGMPGHMGQVRRTAQNLEIIQVRDADHVLLIKGAIPGAAGDYVIIREAKKLSRERVVQIKARAEERAKSASGKKGKAGVARPAAAPAAAPATAAKK